MRKSGFEATPNHLTCFPIVLAMGPPRGVAEEEKLDGQMSPSTEVPPAL